MGNETIFLKVRSEEWRCGAQIKKRREFGKSARVKLLLHYREPLTV